jgi:hypothetical protein
MDEKEIEVLLDDGVLTLRGEKRSETEDKDRQFSERTYGRFERRIPLGYEIEEYRVDARFRNGVLSVTLPKTAKAQSQAKRIAIKNCRLTAGRRRSRGKRHRTAGSLRGAATGTDHARRFGTGSGRGSPRVPMG